MIVCPHCEKKIFHLEYTFHVRREIPLGSFHFIDKEITSAGEAMNKLYKLQKRFLGRSVSWSVREV